MLVWILLKVLSWDAIAINEARDLDEYLLVDSIPV